jgi:putative transcriptional regulator
MTTLDLTNHFLIAMPTLTDPHFQRTVTVLCSHNEEGAMGVVVNRPARLSVGGLLGRLELTAATPEIAARPVFQGGPVQRDWGLVVHRFVAPYDQTLPFGDGLAVTLSRDIFAAIAAGDGPQESLVAMGYAGWGAGQLEEELAQNAWLSGPLDPDILFHTPAEHCWYAAAALVGVDLNRISRDVGHA